MLIQFHFRPRFSLLGYVWIVQSEAFIVAGVANGSIIAILGVIGGVKE